MWRQRRAGLKRGALEKLARADAFQSIGLDRRRALWTVKGLADEKPLPLFDYALGRGPEHQFLREAAALLGIADSLVELKSVCKCGRKATMNLRVDAAGKAVREGAQTEIGGEERYVALCRRHFMQRLRDPVSAGSAVAG